ncbi:MAG: alpha/beta hydrolase [Saprospiraceae bacterium]|nr:alpha/beta hydrolase [Saprospiraceae bacterium]
MKIFNIGGVPVACKIAGEGPDIVLLHGFCEDSNVWTGTVGALVAGGFRATVIDLPGFGQSGLLLHYSMEAMAEVVHDILETLGVENCTLLGHSMGGYVAMAFAERWPESLNGLGLIHSHPFDDKPERKAARIKSAEFIRKNGHHTYVAQLITNLFPQAFAADHPGLINGLIETARAYPSAAIVGGQEAMTERPDRSAVLKNLTCPVLFIVGELDSAIPYDQSLLQLPLPAIASVHLLEGIGHMGMFEAPEKIHRIVLAFANFQEEIRANNNNEQERSKRSKD